MLFWTLVLLFVGGIIWCAIDEFSMSGTLIVTFSALAIIGSLVGIIISHAGTEAEVANWAQAQTAIEVKIESGLFADEFGLFDKNVINEIKEYNTSLNTNKALQRNFWLGIYVPNIYDDIELISYDIIPSRN